MPTVQLLADLGDVLNIGSEGPEVRMLQETLRKWGFDPGPIDGVYGQKTKEAVAAVQRKLGLKADGIWGPQALAASSKDIANPATSVLLRGANVVSLRLPASALPSAPPAPGVEPTAMVPAGQGVPFYQQPWFMPAALIGGGALLYFFFGRKKAGAPAVAGAESGSTLTSDIDALSEELAGLEKPRRRAPRKSTGKRSRKK